MKALRNLILILVLLVLAVVMIFGGEDIKLRLTYVLIFAAAIAALACTAMGMISNIKSYYTGLIRSGLLALLIIIMYLIAPVNDIEASVFEKTETSLSWSPIIGAGLYTIYALLAIFVLSFVVLSIRNAFK